MNTVELLKHRISLINDTRSGLECFLQGEDNATVANQLAIMQALVELLEKPLPHNHRPKD